MAGGAELAELAHELEQLGGHGDIVKEVQAEVAGAGSAGATDAGTPKHVRA
jgi:simple sugar transport system ATP-binding protein